MPALTSVNTGAGEFLHSDFFVFITLSPFFYPEAGRAYLQIRGARRSCCLRARGVLHPGVNRGWGDPVHLGILVQVSTLESSTFLYIFSVTIIHTSDMCRSVSPKKRSLSTKRRCALGENPGRMTVTPSSAPLSGRSGVGRVKSGAKTQSIRRLYELPSIVWAW